MVPVNYQLRLRAYDSNILRVATAFGGEEVMADGITMDELEPFEILFKILNMSKKIIFIFLVFLFCQKISWGQKNTIYHDGWIDFNKNGILDVYENPDMPVEQRVEDVLSRMTLEEKTNQMATLYGYGRVLKDELPTPEWKNEIWKDGIANIDEDLNSLAYHEKAQTGYSYPFHKHAAAINIIQRWFIENTRLGIPVDFTNEGIRGLCHDRATALPAPIAVSSTWDRSLLRQAGDIIGREAKALGYTNVYAPILDISRDPRWGRTVETYGEDPFLVAELGKQMVLGIQEQGVASTVKHFAVYSVPNGGRDGNARTDPHVTPHELHELFLYPFRRVIKEAHPKGVMSSYNDWDGTPVTGSYYFLTQLLRNDYGFKGYVVSDSRAVKYIWSKHRTTGDYKKAIRQAVIAGLNVRTDFTPPEDFILPLRELVRDGELSMKTIDSRVADVLRVKFDLGLFDHPIVNVEDAGKIVRSKDTAPFMLKISEEAMVLLKNENQLLPLDLAKLKNILVTGPLAAETGYSVSRYGPSNIHVVSVLEGLKNYIGTQAKINYTKGCDVVDATWPESELIATPLTAEEEEEIAKAVEQAKYSDVIIAVLGEGREQVGESLSRTSLSLPGRQQELLQALYETGKPVVLLLINGRPLTINWADQFIPAILECWFPGESGGTAIARILFGESNPGGKLTVTFPKTIGQIPLNFPFKPGANADQPSEGNNGYGKTRVNGSLYPFGYGLSYTSFSYSNLDVTNNIASDQDSVPVVLDVTNTGKYQGDEIVQLYVRDMVCSLIPYDMQLRGFERVSLDPGETKQVTFVLTRNNFSFFDSSMKETVEPGEFEIIIGSSSEDIRLQKKIKIKKY
ncbi:MAG: glycoside hydrolase family 3 N-terminal domain-containing protein [Mangrovibacterium sp.]